MDNKINSVLTDKRDCLTVIAKEWFDKVNGNSYFSARVYINNDLIFVIPFQYGYGDFFMQETTDRLRKKGLLELNESPYSKFCVLTTKHVGCKQKDVKYWGDSK